MSNQTRYYHRGQGECVVPTEPHPAFIHGTKVLPEDRRKWGYHLASLPIVAHCPSTAPIGFLDGWVEGYQVKVGDEWHEVDKVVSDHWAIPELRRLFLTPPVSTGERKEEENERTLSYELLPEEAEAIDDWRAGRKAFRIGKFSIGNRYLQHCKEIIGDDTDYTNDTTIIPD